MRDKKYLYFKVIANNLFYFFKITPNFYRRKNSITNKSLKKKLSRNTFEKMIPY